MTDQKHPGQARDIDLAAWLDGVGFHPADTERKQRGHELARLMTAAYATHLHYLLPPGRDKSLVFTHLEDVLVRANRALALGGGPRDGVELEPSADGTRAGLRAMVNEFKTILAELEAVVPYDPRISEYEARQRGEDPAAPVAPLVPLVIERAFDGGMTRQLEIGLTGVGGGKPEVVVTVVEHDEGENFRAVAEQFIDSADELDRASEYLAAMAGQLRQLQARPLPAAGDVIA